MVYGRQAHSAALGAVLFLGTLVLGASGAHAAYTLTFSQSASGVSAFGTGTINLTYAKYLGQSAVTGAYVDPNSQPDVVTGPSADSPATYLALYGFLGGVGGPSSIGPGDRAVTYPDAGSGDTVGISGPNVYVPLSTTSFSVLISGSLFPNQTLDSLGLTPGTYRYILYGSGPNPSQDTFTIVVAARPESGVPVPEPAGLGLFGAGLLSLFRACRKPTRG